jgi:ribosomal protein S6
LKKQVICSTVLIVMANQTQTNERVRRYEVGYLVAPTIPEKEVEGLADDIADTVADHGDVLATQVPETQELAYTMEATTSAGEREFDRGQFGWVQFAVTPDVLDDIEDAFDAVDDIMRHLLIKIDDGAVGGRDREKEDEDRQKDTEAKSTDDDEVPPEEQGDESGKDDDGEDDQ